MVVNNPKSHDLTFVLASLDSFDAELASDHAGLGEAIAASVEEWPPIGGLWNNDAVAFFRSQAASEPFVFPWGPMYVLNHGVLVASAGFFGPPDDRNEVEVGYSVCQGQRRQGIATEIVRQFIDIATEHECASLRAHTTSGNTASLMTLKRNGLVEVEHATNDEGVVEVLLRVELPSS